MYKKQIPRGDEDLKCPLWQKPMAEVCHTCPWWFQLRGKDPQSEQEIDEWKCAIGMMPYLLVENSQRQRQTAAAVDKVATEMQKSDAGSMAVINTLGTMLNRVLEEHGPRVIANGNLDAAEKRLIGSQ